ncbi:MAG: winged helix-turn-helix transcriptional regulator [Deltaproteobacteria bacterium]|nr:winged helix-turn-helix transcriptional regulator [Deltaproteobacteria bacterium]MBW2308670.1 winged helix-turn-helix transcriptional regulator [Deltaproteobacteria bacterium]
MDHLVVLFKALSNEHRIRILQFLRERGRMEKARGEEGVCVCHIQEAMDLAVSTTSQHLKVLKQAGLVRSKKKGKWMYYSIDEKGMQRFKDSIHWLW